MFIAVKIGTIIFEHVVSVERKMMQLVELIILLGIGVGVYFGSAYALKMQELTSIIDVVKRKFLKKKA